MCLVNSQHTDQLVPGVISSSVWLRLNLAHLEGLPDNLLDWSSVQYLGVGATLESWINGHISDLYNPPLWDFALATELLFVWAVEDYLLGS